jgi:murein DD-endopeptidase MepM/ murein hydrolase activator NlpD
LWSDPIKKNLDDFNAGKVKSYDPIFDTLALNIPGKTGWDLANELHRTINGTDLKKTVKQEAIEAQGPAVQRFIRAEGVTPNRIRRGQIMDDPQGSFNPRPAAFEAIPKENFTLETPGSGSYQPGFDVWIPSKRVPALYPGIVKDVRTQYNADGSGYGNFVVIESTNPLTGQKFDVLVSHLAERTPLREGQRVAPGQIIGTQGGTGSVRSVDGTITSYDFLAVAPKGSGSMKPADNLDELRNDAINRLQGGV